MTMPGAMPRPTPRKMPRALSIPAAVALAGLLAACGGTSDYYLLPPPQPAAERFASPVGTIAVADISLPTYAEALEIAELVGPGTLTLDSAASWADTPRRALTRHLAAALEARLNARVGTDPWPGYDDPGLRIEVAADRFVGAPDTGLVFTGQYFAVVPESGRIVAAERFSIQVPPQGEGFVGLATAHARAMDVLADDIAARIAGRARPAA
jgi:uncharacterized lipoprotein YmbA